MTKIILPIGKSKTAEELEKSATHSFVSWDTFMPHLRKIIGLYGSEVITGLVIDEKGIKIDITNKRKLKAILDEKK